MFQNYNFIFIVFSLRQIVNYKIATQLFRQSRDPNCIILIDHPSIKREVKGPEEALLSSSPPIIVRSLPGNEEHPASLCGKLDRPSPWNRRPDAGRDLALFASLIVSYVGTSSDFNEPQSK